MSKPSQFEKKWKTEVGNENSNPNSIWEQLEEIDPVPTPPPNSFTTQEYAEKRGISRRHASDKLERLAKDGKIRKHLIPGSRLPTYWTIA